MRTKIVMLMLGCIFLGDLNTIPPLFLLKYIRYVVLGDILRNHLFGI